MKTEVIEQAWSSIYPGQFVRWTTPSFVRRGTVVSIKGRSMRVRFGNKEQVIPDAKHYWAQHKMQSREYGLCVIKELPGGKKAEKFRKNKNEDMISTHQAVELFNISGKELRRWLRNGRVRGSQKKGQWTVSAQSLGRYLAERK